MENDLRACPDCARQIEISRWPHAQRCYRCAKLRAKRKAKSARKRYILRFASITESIPTEEGKK